MNDTPTTPELDRVAPHSGSLATLIFKSLAGLGVGLAGTVILLIFVFAGLGVSGAGSPGPFFLFTAIIMGLLTSLTTNLLATSIFSAIDRTKYTGDRRTMRHVSSLNIMVFVLLLPVYVVASAASFEATRMIFMIAALQLMISAQASAYVLELSAAHNNRDRLLAVYGVTFGILGALIVNIIIYGLTELATLQVDADTGRATSSAATALLFGMLPATWFFFGLATTSVDMFYRWMYQVWGTDILNDSNE